MHSYTEFVMVRGPLLRDRDCHIKGVFTSYSFKQQCHENRLISWRSQIERRNNFSQHLVENYYNLVTDEQTTECREPISCGTDTGS